SRGSVGILKSTASGRVGSWFVVGTRQTNNYSGAVFAGARITTMAVDQNNANIVYVAVAAGGAYGPGVYRTLHGGASWTAILSTANLFKTLVVPPAIPALVPGTTLASVTSLVIDPRNSQDVTIGLGNIGLVANSITAGVWKSANANNYQPT